MERVASRELRNQTRSFLDRAAAGEEFAITVDGRLIAMLGPIPHRTRWMPRESFLHRVATHQADAALRDELTILVPDTTDELPL